VTSHQLLIFEWKGNTSGKIKFSIGGVLLRDLFRLINQDLSLQHQGETINASAVALQLTLINIIADCNLNLTQPCISIFFAQFIDAVSGTDYKASISKSKVHIIPVHN
jgi:hypothetical protein